VAPIINQIIKSRVWGCVHLMTSCFPPLFKHGKKKYDVTNIYLFIFWGTPKEITIKFDGKRVIKKCLLNYFFTISMVTLWSKFTLFFSIHFNTSLQYCLKFCTSCKNMAEFENFTIVKNWYIQTWYFYICK
jgi:hypothetical protein